MHAADSVYNTYDIVHHVITWPWYYDVYLKDNCNLYLVTEFVPGGELFVHLQKTKLVSEDHARFYAVQVCLALEYLHGQGIVYRWVSCM